MKRTIAMALAFVVLVGSAAMAGTFPKEQVGSAAKWAAYVDVKEMLGSELGQYLLTEAKARGLEKKIQEGVDKLGLDVTKDLHSVLLYGESFGGADGVAIFRGVFNKDKVLAELAKNPTDKESKSGNYSIHQWTDTNKGHNDDGTRFGTFYQDGVVIIARTEKALLGAIDVLDGKAANLAKEGKLEIPDVKGSFILAAAEGFVPPKAAAEGAPAAGRRHGPEANLMQNITKGWMAAGCEDETLFLKMNATTKTPEDAARMAQMAQGLLAMAQLAASQPQGEEPAAKPAIDLTPLLAGIKIANKDNVMQVEMAVAVKDMKEILGAAMKFHDARKAAPKE